MSQKKREKIFYIQMSRQMLFFLVYLCSSLAEISGIAQVFLQKKICKNKRDDKISLLIAFSLDNRFRFVLILPIFAVRFSGSVILNSPCLVNYLFLKGYS